MQASYEKSNNELEAFKSRRALDPRLENSTSTARRSAGRYEISANLTRLDEIDRDNEHELTLHPLLTPLLHTLLGSSRLEIDTLSTVTSEPNTPYGHW